MPKENSFAKKLGIIIVAGVVVAIIVFTIRSGGKEESIPANNQSINLEENREEKITVNKTALGVPQMQIDKSKTYQAILSTTEGKITLNLFADKTSVTVNNFVYLARKGFYDKTVFHRVIKGFMIQGGDPKGDGTGGPGYTFNDESFEGKYARGIVAMANAGPNTNGSQFFIIHQDYDLPPNYVIFGEVVEGIEVVDKIAEAGVKQSPTGEGSQPIKPVVVESVEIIEE